MTAVETAASQFTSSTGKLITRGTARYACTVHRVIYEILKSEKLVNKTFNQASIFIKRNVNFLK